jgi:hypothetical protein
VGAGALSCGRCPTKASQRAASATLVPERLPCRSCLKHVRWTTGDRGVQKHAVRVALTWLLALAAGAVLLDLAILVLSNGVSLLPGFDAPPYRFVQLVGDISMATQVGFFVPAILGCVLLVVLGGRTPKLIGVGGLAFGLATQTLWWIVSRNDMLLVGSIWGALGLFAYYLLLPLAALATAVVGLRVALRQLGTASSVLDDEAPQDEGYLSRRDVAVAVAVIIPLLAFFVWVVAPRG